MMKIVLFFVAIGVSVKYPDLWVLCAALYAAYRTIVLRFFSQTMCEAITLKSVAFTAFMYLCVMLLYFWLLHISSGIIWWIIASIGWLLVSGGAFQEMRIKKTLQDIERKQEDPEPFGFSPNPKLPAESFSQPTYSMPQAKTEPISPDVPQEARYDIDTLGAGTAQDEAETYYNLGVAYTQGTGVTPNAIEAVKCWRIAAEQGHAKAQYNLGVAHENGIGVTKDNAEAMKWYRKAASQGHTSAASALGAMPSTLTATLYVPSQPKSEPVSQAYEFLAKGVECRFEEKYRDALKYLDKAFELGLKNEVTLFTIRGTCLEALDWKLDAIDNFSKAIELDPSDCHAWFQRAGIKSACGDKDGALTDCKEAIRLSRNEKNRLAYDDNAKSMGYQSIAGLYEATEKSMDFSLMILRKLATDAKLRGRRTGVSIVNKVIPDEYDIDKVLEKLNSNIRAGIA